MWSDVFKKKVLIFYAGYYSVYVKSSNRVGKMFYLNSKLLFEAQGKWKRNLGASWVDGWREKKLEFISFSLHFKHHISRFACLSSSTNELLDFTSQLTALQDVFIFNVPRISIYSCSKISTRAPNLFTALAVWSPSILHSLYWCEVNQCGLFSANVDSMFTLIEYTTHDNVKW